MRYEKLKQLIFLKGTKSKILDVLENNRSIDFIEYADQNNNTALHYAISYKYDEVIAQYLELLNDYSLWRNKYGNISDQLIRYKINLWINTQNNDGLSALHYASIRGSLRALELLENAGARIDLITDQGLNAFSLSAKKGKIQSMLYFDGKIDANATDHKKCSALHWATYENKVVIVKYLVAKHRGQINFQQEQGRTALHLAVLFERQQIVQILLVAGANRLIKDKQNNTAFDYADRNQNQKIIEFLSAKQDGVCLKSNKYAYRQHTSKKIGPTFFLFLFLLSVSIENYLLKRYYEKGMKQLIFNFGTLLLQFFYTMVCFIMTLFIYIEKPNIFKISSSQILHNVQKISQYCFNCENYKEEGIQHCYICNKCFHMRIKHNNFFDCCIGQHNLTAYFVLLILLVLLLASYIKDGVFILLAFISLKDEHKNIDVYIQILTYLMVSVNLVVVVPLIMMCRELFNTYKIKKKMKQFLLLKQFSETTFDSSSTLIARKISLAKEIKFGVKRDVNNQ